VSNAKLNALGHEGRAVPQDHQAVRLWLRMLSATMDIELEIRKRLRNEFGITLARFDYLAQLHRYPEGLRMNALSKRLMVTGGNVTGLSSELEKEGWVKRQLDENDRRATKISLTPLGQEHFETMAAAHESWITELFSGLDKADKTALHDLLGKARMQFSKFKS
jgi:DNA-binding MarR family transcriptional regulator